MNGPFWLSEELWIAVITNAAVLLVWGARLETRVGQIEKQIAELTEKIEKIDRAGTREAGVIADRVERHTDELKDLATRVEDLGRGLNQRLDTAVKFLEQLKLTVDRNDRS